MGTEPGLSDGRAQLRGRAIRTRQIHGARAKAQKNLEEKEIGHRIGISNVVSLPIEIRWMAMSDKRLQGAGLPT